MMRTGRKTWSVVTALLVAGAPAFAGGADPAMVSNTCAGCHGTRGMSEGQAPVIAGLPEAYLRKAMMDYRSGDRFATIMGRIAKGYSEAEIDAMAAYFAGQAWEPAVQETDAALVARGEKIFEEKLWSGCHGASGIRADATTPPLAGQYADYLYFQMRDYANTDRAIPEAAEPMRSLGEGLTDEDLRALAHYLASQI